MNLTSAVELSCSAGAGTCTVLGTTRVLGMHNRAEEHGVRTTTVYQVETSRSRPCEKLIIMKSRQEDSSRGHKTILFQPTIDYPDLSQAAQITDDSHSPHYKWDRYSAYIREYTGWVVIRASLSCFVNFYSSISS